MDNEKKYRYDKLRKLTGKPTRMYYYSPKNPV